MGVYNLNNIRINTSGNGKYLLEVMFFKGNLINLLLIHNSLESKLQEFNNNLDLRYINFGIFGSGIMVKTGEEGAILENIKGVIIQKSNLYNNYKEGFVSYNIISYNLTTTFKSENYFSKGLSYEVSEKGSNFFGFSNKTDSYVLYRPKINYIGSSGLASIDINSLIYYPSKDIVLGLKNDFDNKIFSYIPLLRPCPIVTVRIKTRGTNTYYINFQSEEVFETQYVGFDEKLVEKFVPVRTLQITNEDIDDENIHKYVVIESKFETDNIFYKKDYDDYPIYNIKLNIISIKFINNFSTNQENNKILINTNTNNSIDNIYNYEKTLNLEERINKNYVWGEDLPLVTNDSYLNLKISGITENRLNSLKLSDLNLKILVINKNEKVLNVYVHIPNSDNYKINKNTDDYENITFKNNVIQIIPQAKENTSGQDGLVGIKILDSNNKIFEDMIIKDIYVKIAGIKSNLSKLLINLNRNYGANLTGETFTLNTATLYSEIIRINTVDDNFFKILAIEDNLEFIDADGNVNAIAGKNPKILNLTQEVTRNYKIKMIETSSKIDFFIERDTYDDKSLGDYIGEFNLVSELNPDIIGTEAEVLYFDLSDHSNFRKKIKFYKDENCLIELLYPNFLEYAEYSRNFISGEAGSFVKIRIPNRVERNQLNLSNENPTIYFKIDIENQEKKEVAIRKITILNLRRLFHGEITIQDVYPNTNTSGILTYDNEPSTFYDPDEVKPRIDISFNLIFNENRKTYYKFSDNIFNEIQYLSADDGFFSIKNDSINTFMGDNMISTENIFEFYETAFYIRNSSILNGVVSIGISNANIQNNLYNNHLFDITNGNLSLKQYPIDLENTEKKISSGSSLNNTNYNIYLTLNFTNTNKQELVHFFIKYGDSYNSTNYIESIEVLGESLFDGSNGNNDFIGESINNVYLSGHIINNTLYMALFLVSEDSDGYINKFLKIQETEVTTQNSTYFTYTAQQFLTLYNDINNITDNQSEITTKLYYSRNNDFLKLAYIRKKFNFIPKVYSNGNIIENKDIILFQPLNIYYNKENNTQQQNEFLVGILDTEQRVDGLYSVIRFFTIILKHEKPFFTNIGNSSKAIIMNNSILESWFGVGLAFGLFLTKPKDLIELYNERKIESAFDKQFDTVIKNPTYNIYLQEFRLPLLESKYYNDYTIEYSYLKKFHSDSRVEIRIFKKNIENINNPIQIGNTFVFRESENPSHYNKLTTGDLFIDVDVSGQIIANLPGNYNLASGNEEIKTPFIITYQVTDQNSNNLIDKLSESTKFFNFSKLTGQINTYKKLNKKVLNVKSFRTPTNLNQNETQADKDIFSNFMSSNNVNTVINKQTPFTINRVKLQDRKVDQSSLTKTGIGKIRYFSKEINTNREIDISSAYTGVYGEDILFNVVNVGIIENIRMKIINEKEVDINWEYENNNLTVEVLFIIYRSQSSESIKKYEEIGRTTNRFFRDYNAVPFLQAFYKIESIITWENIEMSTGVSYAQTFICENNNFEYGRYDNTTDNPKLYKPINKSCGAIQMVGISKTGNLFPNSYTLTKKMLYTELSRAKFRPFR